MIHPLKFLIMLRSYLKGPQGVFGYYMDMQCVITLDVRHTPDRFSHRRITYKEKQASCLGAFIYG